MVSAEAVDLLTKMLVYDKNKRIRVEEAINHPYFDPIRDIVNSEEKMTVHEMQVMFDDYKR